MNKIVLAACVAISFNVNAADTTYEFFAKTKDCISQLFENCPIINTNGLTGNITVDTDALNDGNGIIAFNNFKGFEATNGLTAWNKNDLIEGAARFINYEVVEFNVKTKIDISNGWDVDTNGTGEELLIDNFGGIVGTADSSVSSWDGTLYCVATDQFYPDTETCIDDFVVLNTYGISAQYHKATINLKAGTIIDKGDVPEEVKVPIEMPAPAPTPAAPTPAPQASAEPQNESETSDAAKETDAKSVGSGSTWLFAPFLLGLITTIGRKVKIKS